MSPSEYDFYEFRNSKFLPLMKKISQGGAKGADVKTSLRYSACLLWPKGIRTFFVFFRCDSAHPKSEICS